MKTLSAFFIFASLLSGQPLFAEYRVFELQLRGPDGQVQRSLASTLDPEQYRVFYPIPEGFSVTYEATWMCKGRTSYLQPCPNPRLKTETEPPPGN